MAADNMSFGSRWLSATIRLRRHGLNVADPGDQLRGFAVQVVVESFEVIGNGIVAVHRHRRLGRLSFGRFRANHEWHLLDLLRCFLRSGSHRQAKIGINYIAIHAAATLKKKIPTNKKTYSAQHHCQGIPCLFSSPQPAFQFPSLYLHHITGLDKKFLDGTVVFPTPAGLDNMSK